jgi:hypothetical protein
MRSIYVAVAAMLLAPEARGQIAITTSLVGTITDASDKTIAGARISAVNQGSGHTYSSITNEQGNYSFQFIEVGTYSLVVEKAQFQRVEKTGILVENNQVIRNDVTLALGSLSQSVTVQASTPAIATDDATVSEYLTSRDVSPR